ncbi:MAG: Coenzyme F420 hydrogenase/dehydrogenase, beta subunit C-terminal domain [Clostridia bacterium]|nr:Coenzyme F420 hydrogenase/dehydrogenase, beta subunit C-terminal domain [Clostridia bacterium]
MQRIVDFENCSGCHACFNVCPKSCISMKPDGEGFLYPEIDNEKCIDCGMCQKVCPVLTEYKGKSKGSAYACINKDDETRKNSSSGGMFSLIAEHILSQGGIVFGAAFDEDLSVCHVEINCTDDLHKLRGSKYLQSRIGNTYKKVKVHLELGKTVLFSGTPCQISGLITFLGKDYENLLLQDIICHGVPSPFVWREYLKFRGNQTGGKAEKASFRDKSYGWKRYFVKLDFAGGRKYMKPFDKDLFMRAFLNNLCLRPSCYACHSKSVERQSDITLADFWGIENICPELFDNKGTSLMLVNSPNGQALFDAVKEKMEYREVDFDKAIKNNSSISVSAKLPPKRDEFMSLIKNKSFDKAVKKCVFRKKFSRAVRLTKRIVKKVTGK